MSIFGLFIGNDYKGSDYSLPDCELDAARVASTFRKYCRKAILLTGKKASRAGVIAAVASLKPLLKSGDELLVSNSGHGTQLTKHGKRIEAIVTDGGELIYDFEMQELLDDERPADSLVAVFSDSCFSGGLTRAFAPGRQARSVPVERCHAHAAAPRGVPRLPTVFFSGCRRNEESYSTGKGGAMTNAVLKAFGELGPTATYGELFRRIAGQGGLLPTRNWPQHPECDATSPELLELALGARA